MPLIEKAQAFPGTKEYRIGSGDMLNVMVWDNPDLTQVVLVKPDGRITLTLLQEVEVVGLTLKDLNNNLSKQYAKYLKSPLVTVMLVQANNHVDNQIQIIGEAMSPAAIPYQAGMTVLDAIIKVGGLSDYAEGNRTILNRKIEKNIVQYRVRLHDLLKKGDLTANALVYPGDIIMIPQSWF